MLNTYSFYELEQNTQDNIIDSFRADNSDLDCLDDEDIIEIIQENGSRFDLYGREV